MPKEVTVEIKLSGSEEIFKLVFKVSDECETTDMTLFRCNLKAQLAQYIIKFNALIDNWTG